MSISTRLINAKKILIIIIVFLALINSLFFLTDTTYIYKAIRYTTADIDDYKIFENQIVLTGEIQQWSISSRYNQLQLPDTLISELEELKTVAFLIVKDSTILFEKYWGGYEDSTPVNSFSIAKSIVSLLTGIALDEGKIKNLDEPVGNYLSEFNKGEKSKITIRHLLTMTSGLNFEESYLSPFSHTTEAYYGSDLKRLIRKLKVEMKPGTQFRYKSGDTQILSFILEKATGKTLSNYAAEKIWKPIGSEHDALWSLDKKEGVEKAYCCFYSNARDFARLGRLVLQNGKWDNRQIVSEHFIHQSLQPVNINDTEGNTVDYYGFYWWLIPSYKGYDIFYARGILGQYIINIPEKNIIIVRLGKERGEKIGNHYRETFDMIDAVLKTVN